MPRIRTIKPDTFDDPDLCSLPVLARWVFVGLWTQVDKDGRAEDDSRRLKARLIPFDTKADMDAILQLLAPRFITRYAVNGRRFLQVNNFSKHQRPHPKEPPSQIPSPDSADAVEINGEPCFSASSRVDTGSRNGSRNGSGKESLALPQDGNADAALERRDDAFDAFWSAYPKKVGRGAARASWAKIRPSATQAAAMIASLERQRLSSQWLRDGGRYIPNPATWLNQQRWDDDPEPEVPQLSDKSIASIRATREFLGADDDRG
jgi:hypothetical protein